MPTAAPSNLDCPDSLPPVRKARCLAEAGKLRLVRTANVTVREDHDIDALKRRDPDAMKRLVLQETGRVYRVIHRVIHNHSETENLVQETFFQGFRSIDRFNGRSKVSTWLCGIGINLALQHLRKSRRRRSLAEDELERIRPKADLPGFRTLPAMPDAAVERRESLLLLQEGIAQLPASYREIVQLRDIQELPTEVVAERLGITEVNVRVRLHRARNALRTLLSPHLAV